MAAQFDNDTGNLPHAVEDSKATWVRPAVQRLVAGAAEFGADNVPDFGDSES